MIDCYAIRLSASWAHVDPSVVALFDDLKSQFSSSSNFSAYRKMINEMNLKNIKNERKRKKQREREKGKKRTVTNEAIEVP